MAGERVMIVISLNTEDGTEKCHFRLNHLYPTMLIRINRVAFFTGTCQLQVGYNYELFAVAQDSSLDILAYDSSACMSKWFVFWRSADSTTPANAIYVQTQFTSADGAAPPNGIELMAAWFRRPCMGTMVVSVAVANSIFLRSILNL